MKCESFKFLPKSLEISMKKFNFALNINIKALLLWIH